MSRTPTPYQTTGALFHGYEGVLADANEKILALFVTRSEADHVRNVVNAHEELIKIANSRRIELCAWLAEEKDSSKRRAIEERIFAHDEALAKARVQS